MLNEQNALGSLMTAVTTCESNIQSIWTEELENNVLLVIIQVGARDDLSFRKHYAKKLNKLLV